MSQKTEKAIRRDFNKHRNQFIGWHWDMMCGQTLKHRLKYAWWIVRGSHLGMRRSA